MTISPDKRRAWWKRELANAAWLLFAVGLLRLHGFEAIPAVGIAGAAYCIARAAINDRLRD